MIAAFALVTLFGLTVPRLADAANIVVNTGLDTAFPVTDLLCTLREALFNANSNTATYPDCQGGNGVDTITFTAATTGAFIVPAIGFPDLSSDMVIDAADRNITIVGTNARPFTITNGTVELKGLTITGGSKASLGGGIYNLVALTLTNCNVVGNSAVNGGGIYSDGTLVLNNTIVSNNSVSSTFDDAKGGGIFADGILILIDSSVHGNTVSGGLDSYGYGGGIYNLGDLDVTAGSEIYNNDGDDFGGGVHNRKWLTITNSTISGNTACKGGGIYSTVDLDVIESTISGNNADDCYLGSSAQGGGIFNSGGLDVWTSTISYNTATDDGAGIYTESNAYMNDTTINGNTAEEDGGGIYVVPVLGSMSTTGSIIAGNAASVGADCYGAVTTTAGNLLGSLASCTVLSGPMPITGDPMLSSLANNGGDTLTQALLPGSPAIDVDITAWCRDDLDQRGISRPQGPKCDLGAFEMEQDQWTVTTSVGSGFGSFSPSGPQSVWSGETVQFSVYEGGGYRLDTIEGSCGGSFTGSRLEYEYVTNPIVADCTVVAYFSIEIFTVTPSAGVGGSISPSTEQEVNYNATAEFLLTPDPGFVINQVDGSCSGTLSGSTYTTNGITADCTVVASFAKPADDIFFNGFEAP